MTPYLHSSTGCKFIETCIWCTNSRNVNLFVTHLESDESHGLFCISLKVLIAAGKDGTVMDAMTLCIFLLDLLHFVIHGPRFQFRKRRGMEVKYTRSSIKLLPSIKYSVHAQHRNRKSGWPYENNQPNQSKLKYFHSVGHSSGDSGFVEKTSVVSRYCNFNFACIRTRLHTLLSIDQLCIFCSWIGQQEG